MSRVEKDEIYDRYLTRAISEINELGDEIARCAVAPHQAHQPVIGSGHPLADIFLLKHYPMPAELAEGVAFYGRVGQAVLKSVQRLGIDPLLLYGTTASSTATWTTSELKESCPAWLARELAIVQPKMVVVMGPGRAGVPGRPRPAARPHARADARRDPEADADHRGPVRPGDRGVARRAGRQAAVLGRLPQPGLVVRALPPY